MGKTVIITGATRGLGRTIALKLAQEKYHVVLNYRNDHESARAALQACQQINPRTILVRADVACRKDMEHLVQETCSTFGSVDVLINNAGLNIDRSLHEMTDDDWDRVVDTNMKGVFLCSQIVSSRMLTQEHGGIILNIGATTGIQGRVNGINYCASKAGVLVMTKCLALELAPKVRVNCIIPGLIETEEAVERFRLNDLGTRKEREKEIPLGYIGAVEEIANAVAFMVSDAAKYINGQKIIIDGGQFMY